MSTAEAEYVSLSACFAQVICMRTQLLDYGYHYTKIPMYYDSKSAIAISCNPVQHSHTKHINIQYHFIMEHVEQGTIELYFVRMEYKLTDLFTKALPKERFEYLVHRIVMRCMTPTELERLAKLQDITYSVDMFHATLKLLVETLAHLFIAPATLKFIQPFLMIVGYQGIVNKVSAFFTKNLAQPWHMIVHVDYASLLWWDFLHCVQQKKDRLEEDYHSIKDDVPLVSVYTTRNVSVKGMPIRIICLLMTSLKLRSKAVKLVIPRGIVFVFTGSGS
ncbi:hypothetical protein Tco_1491409 [Tanacetum coccineum]